MIKTLLNITLILILSVSATSALANHGGGEHSHANAAPVNKEPDETEINVSENEAVIEVHGIVCSFCSQGVQKKLSKLPFIDTSKYIDGSKVEIENQKVTIAIKPDSGFTMKQVYDAIKSGGYEPVKAFGANGITYNQDGEQCTETISC